jgi:hypothetical protein
MFSYLHDHLTHLLSDQYDLEVIEKIPLLNIVLCPLRKEKKKEQPIVISCRHREKKLMRYQLSSCDVKLDSNISKLKARLTRSSKHVVFDKFLFKEPSEKKESMLRISETS